MPPEFNGKWRVECLNTRLPLPILLNAGYSAKLYNTILNRLLRLPFCKRQTPTVCLKSTLDDFDVSKKNCHVISFRIQCDANINKNMQVLQNLIIFKISLIKISSILSKIHTHNRHIQRWYYL